MARQGDILIVKIDKIPKWTKKSENKTVAYGEVTGHHHTFQGQLQMFEGPKIDMCRPGKYAVIQEAELVHQEHKKQVFKKTIVEIRTQRELNLLAIVQKVMD